MWVYSFTYTANGYQNVLFHVKGKLADYSLKRTTKIKETVAVLLKCSTEEILIGGACPSTSFLLVLSIKEAYSCKLLALEQREKDMLTKLDIDYIVVDLTVINLEHSEGDKFKNYISFMLNIRFEFIVHEHDLQLTWPLWYEKKKQWKCMTFWNYSIFDLFHQQNLDGIFTLTQSISTMKKMEIYFCKKINQPCLFLNI